MIKPGQSIATLPLTMALRSIEDGHIDKHEAKMIAMCSALVSALTGDSFSGYSGPNGFDSNWISQSNQNPWVEASRPGIALSSLRDTDERVSYLRAQVLGDPKRRAEIEKALDKNENGGQLRALLNVDLANDREGFTDEAMMVDIRYGPNGQIEFKAASDTIFNTRDNASGLAPDLSARDRRLGAAQLDRNKMLDFNFHTGDFKGRGASGYVLDGNQEDVTGRAQPFSNFVVDDGAPTNTSAMFHASWGGGSWGCFVYDQRQSSEMQALISQAGNKFSLMSFA